MTEDTIPRIFLGRVKKYGDRVALREKDFGIWQEISWNEYCRHVRHFCLGLIELGLKKGDHVSIFGENEPEWLYADLAIQSAGAVAVGVYPTNPTKESRLCDRSFGIDFCDLRYPGASRQSTGSQKPAAVASKNHRHGHEGPASLHRSHDYII
jgi:long-chain acyl-CoA synthetase